MNEEQAPVDTRVSISLSTLRAELTSLELRLVDRLNGALVNKADRHILEAVSGQVVKNEARLTVLENRAILADSPLTQKVADLDEEMVALREIGKYKKWLWAQTFALVTIALPILFYALDHVAGGGN